MEAAGEEKERLAPLFYLLALFVSLTIILGGVEQNDTLPNALLELLASPLLCAALLRLSRPAARPAGAATALAGLAVALSIPLAQLIPLPGHLWRDLPFHDLAASALDAASVSNPRGPLSVAPFLTCVSFLSALPPTAIFLTTLSLNMRERRALLALFLFWGVASALLGLLQYSQNSSAGAYLYADTGAGEAVGFFRNRNHFAALLYALTPLSVAATLLAASKASKSAQEGGGDFVSLVASCASVFILIVACVMARSRAGVVMLMVSLLCLPLVPRWGSLGLRRGGSRMLSQALLGLVGFSVLFALEYGFFRLLARFEADPLDDARLRITKNTLRAAIEAFPSGTGFGTFSKIYDAAEPVRDTLPHVFVNRAHNDFLEVFLEGGAPALFIMAGFLIWFLSRTRAASRQPSPSGELARAAAVAIGLMLLHSLVDYPLRTQALAGLFAFCCALLLPSPSPRV